MPLQPGQVRISRAEGDFVMGEGTLYDLQDDVNPFIRQVRSEQTGPRAWGHGSYLGAEWVSEAVVPLRVIARGANDDVASCRAALQAMSAAFTSVGTGPTVELGFLLDGDDTEFALFGTTRGFEPDLSTLGLGYAYASAAFVAQDPRIYSAELWSGEASLPLYVGGLTVPYTVPYAVEASPVGGSIEFVNEGTAEAGFTARIDGPVQEPRIAVVHEDGVVQTIRFGLTLQAGQWIEVDSVRKIAPLDGVIGSNQRGNADWGMDQHPLVPGFNQIFFGAADYSEDAKLTVWARSSWW